MKVITRKQQEVLCYLESVISERGRSATLREAADHFGVSLNAIQDRVRGLQRKGLLAPPNGKHCALVPTRKPNGEPRVTATVLREHRCIRCNTATFDDSKPCFECVNVYQVLPAWTAGGLA